MKTNFNKKECSYDRIDFNNDMIDQLEARIRAKASQLDEARRIDVQQVAERPVTLKPTFL